MAVDTDSLDAIFQLDPTISADEPIETREELVVVGEVVPAPARAVTPNPDIPTPELRELNHDFSNARSTISSSIEAVRTALDAAIALAESGDNPIAYDTLGKMLTAIVQANKELVALHDTKEKVTSAHRARTSPGSSNGPTGTPGNVNIEKAVFVGRASDLLRELNRIKKDETAS